MGIARALTTTREIYVLPRTLIHSAFRCLSPYLNSLRGKAIEKELYQLDQLTLFAIVREEFINIIKHCVVTQPV
jgi:hypothetical protein